MANANTNINVANLDFDSIKNNLIAFLKSGTSPVNDYNYDGSVISTVLDVLSYNTYYNAFYLNMVANEMFLDTALKRSSVISHAKVLGYQPRSSVCAKSIVNLTITNISGATFTLDKYTTFQSEAVNGVNYPFVVADSKTLPVINSSVTFNDIELYQGQPVSYTFQVDNLTNPTSLFKLPDDTIDTSTLNVVVLKGGTTNITTYKLATDYLMLDSTSQIYFLQESLDGYYEIYFGDGILGSNLTSGDSIIVEYLTTRGSDANSVKKFTIMSNIGSASTFVTTTQIASGGSGKESISNIKFHAPKSFSSQNRAVSTDDYITAIQQNKYGYTFDAVNVWGGERNDPPVYGQVFISLKPQGSYLITESQKLKIINDVIKPVSVMTVEPRLVDPDYTYIKLSVNVIYDQTKTILSKSAIKDAITALIRNFANSTLNTFNSTFVTSELNSIIQNADNSIVANEINIQVQKKIYPNFNVPTTYSLYYGVPLEKGSFSKSITSYPPLQFRDNDNLTAIIDGVSIEEVPQTTVGVESISILNGGFNYTSIPTITIIGDGLGATATATLSASGSIKSIIVTNAGSGYSSAIAVVTPSSSDKSGRMASLIVNLSGRYGTLRSYYTNTKHAKVIYNSELGTVDYNNGIITLNTLNPLGIGSDSSNNIGALTVSAIPSSSILSSSFNRIITLDPFDPSAVIVNVMAKS